MDSLVYILRAKALVDYFDNFLFDLALLTVGKLKPRGIVNGKRKIRLFYFAYIRRFWPIITVCFLKGFLFCFGAAAVSIAFGSAGWLVRLLLQFTDVCLIPVFSWLVLRHCSAGARPLQKDAVICGAVVVLICSLDYCVVSPYLAMLIEI